MECGRRRLAVFLDRDGVLNEDTGYVSRPKDWRWLPGTREALTRLKAADFLLIVVTNQSGIARGYYAETDVHALHAWVNAQLAPLNAPIDVFYLCPHHPSLSPPCLCRKPRPGMLLRAAREWNVDMARSWMVGDSLRDVEAGMAAGCRTLLLGKDAPDLLGAADLILKTKSR